MRSRIMGGAALILGLLFMYVVLTDSKALAIRPLLGAVAFIGLGGYYLITGKRAATRSEFINEGKLAHDDAPAPPKAGAEVRS